jgi:hypothetical protein
MFNHIIARFNLTAGHARLGFALLSLFALVLGGSAGSRWS